MTYGFRKCVLFGPSRDLVGASGAGGRPVPHGSLSVVARSDGTGTTIARFERFFGTV